MLGAGSSSLVYCVGRDRAMKQFNTTGDLHNEKTIYKILGLHPRLPVIHSFGADFILMDRIQNGDLARFIESHPEIAKCRRLQWVTQIAECFALLHKHQVSHCDSKLENFLVDDKYDLKICDFASSHYYKAPSQDVAIQPSRYRRPIDDFDELVFNPADDIFAFGSICYEIMKGSPPFSELKEEEAEVQFALGNFPAIGGLSLGQVVKGCWTNSFTSFEAVLSAIRKEGARDEGRQVKVAT